MDAAYTNSNNPPVVPDWLATVPVASPPLPAFLVPSPASSLPSFLAPPVHPTDAIDPADPTSNDQRVPREYNRRSRERRELEVAEYSMVLPRVLDRIYEGSTLAAALRELPIAIDQGGFMRWLKKNPQQFELYKEAKELRTEVWAGKIIQHAEGVDDDGNIVMEDVSRSKLIVETYKWLMQSDNRRTYGDTKTVEFGGQISITAALAEAQGRVLSAGVDEVLTELPSAGRALLGDGEEDDE